MSGSPVAERPPGEKSAARGERQRQFLDAVAAKPGITVTEVAKQYESDAWAFYAIVRKAAKEEVVTKSDSGYEFSKSGVANPKRGIGPAA